VKIKLKNGKSASEDSIHELEAELGCSLSESFRAFVRANDGSSPETNIFKINEKNESGVNAFIPIRDIANEQNRIENLPRKAYPVAWAEGGNYVFIDEGNRGRVFFWDHQEPENTTQIAESFGAFLALLEPFDVKSIELKPGQVKSAWINPDFLKHLKK